MVVYSFNDETLEGIFEEWPFCRQQAQKYLDLVSARAEIIEDAITNKKELKNLQESFLRDGLFKDVRKAMRLFTHDFKRTIKAKEENPSFSPITEDNFKRMKEISSEADNWYKQFNKAVKKYRDVETHYYTILFGISEAVDFTCEKVDFIEIVNRMHR